MKHASRVPLFSLLGLFAALWAGPTAAASTIFIDCPKSVTLKLDWPNKIGSNPTFRAEDKKVGLPIGISSIRNIGQTIQCQYGSSAPLMMLYQYDVKRPILRCSPHGELNRKDNTLQCLVE